MLERIDTLDTFDDIDAIAVIAVTSREFLLSLLFAEALEARWSVPGIFALCGCIVSVRVRVFVDESQSLLFLSRSFVIGVAVPFVL